MTSLPSKNKPKVGSVSFQDPNPKRRRLEPTERMEAKAPSDGAWHVVVMLLLVVVKRNGLLWYIFVMLGLTWFTMALSRKGRHQKQKT